MSENNPADTPREPDTERVSELRRRVLQALAAAAVGVTVLPSAWTKPIVGSIVVPAHAQVSPASPTPGLSQSNTPTLTPEVSLTPSPTPSLTPGLSLSRTATPTPTRSRTPTPTPSLSPTPTPTPSPSSLMLSRGVRSDRGPLGMRR